MTDTIEPETDPHEVGQQISELLAALSAHADPSVGAAAEDLARLLMGMYGAGLQRIVALLAGAVPAGERLLGELLDDDLVSSLLVLHDLHPEDTATRVARALESVRPYLGSHAGDVELLGVADTDEGAVVELALRGSCDGCPSSAITVTTAIEKAIEEACPEVVRVDVEGLAEPTTNAAGGKELPVLQIGVRPPEPEPTATPVAWVVLEPPELRPGQCAQVEVGGAAVLLALPAGAHAPDTVRRRHGDAGRVSIDRARAREESGGRQPPKPAGWEEHSEPGIDHENRLVAYTDECPSCHRPLASATLMGDVLTCAGCSVAFDVRRAGRALDGSTRHLAPLPLVRRAGGWRLAVPRPMVGAAS